MKHQRAAFLLAMCTTLAACDPSTTIGDSGGKIVLRNNLLTLHVDGKPDAMISAKGDLDIDARPISATPAERGMLMLYYQDVLAMREQSLQMGQAGAKLGFEAMKNKLSGNSTTESKKHLDDEARLQTRQLQLKFCQDQIDIKAVQGQLAAQLSAFAPYGAIVSDKDITDCQKDAAD
ncbi:hypothetical protein ISP15_01990 [Dyella jejuensis]|uniref:DUF2884 family protein n=1 Tax=Dyella jejuensis TaxID=1432009 RepID=A0ABW8JE33_9GAMM